MIWIRRHQWTQRSPSQRTGTGSQSRLGDGTLTKPAGSFGTCLADTIRTAPASSGDGPDGGTAILTIWGSGEMSCYPIVEWIDLPEGGVSFFTDRPNGAP